MDKTAPQAYVYYGPDDFSKKEALDHLKATVGMSDVLDANTTTLKAQGLTLPLLRDACGAIPFLADRRLIIVEGLLKLLEEPEGQRPARGRGPRAQRSGQDQWEALPQLLQELPPTTLLVFLDGDFRRPPLLLKELSSHALVRRFAPPEKDALHAWIHERVARAGGSIQPAAASLLAETVGGDLWALSGEVEKLVLHANGRPIERKDVEELTANRREASIFRAVDALLAGQAAQAMQMLLSLRDSGAEVSYILTMIARQLRFVLVAQELLALGVRGEGLGQRVGVQPFAMAALRDQARRHPPAQLERMYRLLLQTDVSIKTGALSDQLALESLVAELAGD
ncbi:MAG: DNA polymerase III subunit delta [Chloroflexi bacterium]|nr:DNA polymerase III subunit delta [Chloroflexota bacterium]